MAERLPSSPETQKGPEKGEVDRNLERAQEQLERKAAKAEKAHEKERQDAERAVEREAKPAERPASAEKSKRPTPQRVTKEEKERTFNLTMKRVQGRLNPVSRTFSKVIHNKAVEATSEVAGKTIARPSGIIGGGIAAFVGLAYVLYSARQVGFELAGSEIFYLLAGGFLFGLVVELLVKGVRKIFA